MAGGGFTSFYIGGDSSKTKENERTFAEISNSEQAQRPRPAAPKLGGRRWFKCPMADRPGGTDAAAREWPALCTSPGSTAAPRKDPPQMLQHQLLK